MVKIVINYRVEAHVQIFLQVQAGQGGQGPPASPGGRVFPTALAVQAAQLDLLDLSAPDPLLSLSGKNTTTTLAIQAIIPVAERYAHHFINLDIPLLSGPLDQRIPVKSKS